MIWKTLEGIYMEVKEMETSHIENCIKMLKKNIKGIEDSPEPDDYNQFMREEEQYYVDTAEKKIRGFKEELKNRII